MAKKNAAPLAKDRKSDYWWVDSRRLVEEKGFNRREDYGDIEALAREIRAQGTDSLAPLECYKEGENYVVIKGHRRKKALEILERDGEIIMVRVLMERRGYSKEMRILDQITANEGKKYTPWEQAKVLRDLRSLGWSEEDMIQRSGKSSVYVRRLLSLADAPQKLINLVREGRVSATLAMDRIAEGKTEELIKAAEKVPQMNQNDIGDLFSQHTAATPAAKITKSDIQRPNSVKIFKKWMPEVEEEKLPDEKKIILQWLKRIVAGEVTMDDLKEFFV
jgi:ParB-like chromosome segregation protein Spo0J